MTLKADKSKSAGRKGSKRVQESKSVKGSAPAGKRAPKKAKG